MKRSLLVQTLLNMATGSGGAKLEELIVDAAGTFDAGSGKGYNPVTVPSGSVNVLGEKGVVSNNSVVVTPKAQVVGGWLNSGETSGSGVGVTASELVSGDLQISSNGTHDVTNYSSVTVSIPSGAKLYTGRFQGSSSSRADITVEDDVTGKTIKCVSVICTSTRNASYKSITTYNGTKWMGFAKNEYDILTEYTSGFVATCSGNTIQLFGPYAYFHASDFYYYTIVLV